MKYEFNEVQLNNIKKVVCKYGDLTAGKTERVAVGIGANGLVVPTTYPDEITARHAATAILRSFQRRLYTINVHIPAQEGIYAEKIIELSGFDDEEINRKYSTRSVTTTLDRKGLISMLHLESFPSDS